MCAVADDLHHRDTAIVGAVRAYHGPIESGLLKMMMIGLGKRHGAAHYHRVLLEEPYDPVVRAVGRLMRAKAPIAFGLCTVENGYDETDDRIVRVEIHIFPVRREKCLASESATAL